MSMNVNTHHERIGSLRINIIENDGILLIIILLPNCAKVTSF
jgi:hypothetical protein